MMRVSVIYPMFFFFFSIIFFKIYCVAPYLMFSFLLLTLLALTRYVTVARLSYDNALALTPLSVALYRLCQFLSMFFSLGNVVLRSGLILCRQCFPDCGYSISSIPWPFYSRQFHFMPVPSAFLSILYAAMWRSAVPYINSILCPFIHYTKSSFHWRAYEYTALSDLCFPLFLLYHFCVRSHSICVHIEWRDIYQHISLFTF